MLLQLSDKNHFCFGYNDGWYNWRERPADRWRVAYGRCSRPVMDWRSECIATARAIRSTTNLDLWVLFSGGIDSEVVIQSFMFAGVQIRAAITCFHDDLNIQDVRYAVKFCETHEVPYRLLRLDIKHFFRAGLALRYAEGTKCVQPQLLHTMWAMDQIDGYPILGSGECFLERQSAIDGCGAQSAASIWVMAEKERIASWYRHLIRTQREGCAGFFQYTPEIMLSFLMDETISRLCTNQIEEFDDTKPIKQLVYRKYFLLEPRKKYHGFENVLHLDEELRPELDRKFGDHNAIAAFEYSALVRDLT